MAVSIVPLRSEDHSEWLRLWKGYLKFYETELDDATTAATFARMTRPAPDIHGALARDDEGHAIGLVHWLNHAATWAPAGYCYLEDLFVAPNARGLGAGKALIEHVQSWAATNGSAKTYWLAAETNTVARALYERVASRSGFIHYEIWA